MPNYAISRVGSITAFAPNCKRARYRKNDCKQCLEACPENAISLDPGPEISRACTECGLCVTACPTEVFRDESKREQSLWKRAGKFRASLAAKRQKGDLCVSCHKVAQSGKDSLSIHCLGNLTAYFVAALAFSGYEELKFKRGDCGNCRLKEGEGLFLQSVQKAKVLLAGAGRGGSAIHLEDGGGEEELFSRRRLFSPMATALRRMQQDAGSKGSEDPADSLSGRKLLYRLLENESIPDPPKIKYSPDLPWGQVFIDEKLCSGCGICTAVCPTGALVESLEAGCKVLHFDSAICLNCRLCNDACPQRAAGFEKEFALARGFRDEARVLARIKLSACSLCGDHMWTSNGRLCPTCERRQLTPLCAPARVHSAEAGSNGSIF